MSDPGPLRVGLVGAGMIGQLRARALRAARDMELVAVADLEAERAHRAAAYGSDPLVCTDVGRLAGEAGIDAVIVATPPGTHEEIGVACLEAGKHVLCEKPLASTVAGADRLVETARRAGRVLATGFNLRYTRAALLARRLVDDGEIGALDHVRAFHGHPGGAEFTHDWSRSTGVSGGGTLMDNGIHLIDLACWFLGDVEQAQGFASNHTWATGGPEDNGFLLLRNQAGNVGTLHSSWTEWRGYGYRVEVYGRRGFVAFGYPPLFLVHGVRDDDGKARKKRHWFPGYQITERVRGWEWGLVETLVRDLEAWGSAILEGRDPPITGEDGATAVRLALSVDRGPPGHE